MSATMTRQGGQVQLQYSDMCLSSDIAKMAKGGFSNTRIGETVEQINKPLAEVWEHRKFCAAFSGYRYVKAAIESHLAMVSEHQMDGFLC
jgi:hypothetical protein